MHRNIVLASGGKLFHFLFKARSVRLCVYPHLTCRTLHSRHLTLFALTAGCTVHSCWRGMSPGRDPQRKKQSTSKEFHWWNTIINLYPLYKSSLHPSITHMGWEARGDLLNTSRAQTDLSHVFLYSLL